MPPLSDLRAAVVGTGFVAVLHVDALRRLGVEVTGVVGSSHERAAEKALAAGLPEPYPSFEAMLEDDRVDVVHVTSPNRFHAEQAKAVLAAGKHCVCEKPLAMNSAETAEMLAAAEASGLVHATNFNLRFYPQVLEARARIQDGELGVVHLVTGGYLQDWLLLDTDWNWRLDPSEGGELRAVGDIGSHWIDMIGFVTGLRVEEVIADLATFVPVRRRPLGPVETFAGGGASHGETVDQPMTSEDAAGFMLRLQDGARAVAAVSQVSAGRRNHLHIEVDGSRRALAWDQERPEELWLGHRGRPNEVLLRDPALLSPEAAASTALPAGHAEGYADTFCELYRRVYRAVAAGGSPAEGGVNDYPTFAAGHEQAIIGEALAASAREGRWLRPAR
jgi:predicted dehydrogenase